MPAASTQLASSIQDEIIKFTYAVLRGIKDESFRVIRGNQVPPVLVEIEFISNDKERANLVSSSYQKKLCNGLLNGVLKFSNK
ncbi:N-acetylmuramoyl-L-alanine amidase [Neobacillus drentensis]|uniref:N-acetylmuramoyl-L-alanine amidase family protein n=1 Tax=Neobacillus drentensis TaxID=220684 RepID=UPI002FFEE20E